MLRRSEKLRAGFLAAGRKYLATQSATAEEYSATPEYPAIKDTSFRARKEREAMDWQKQIESVKTVEEKLIKINMPRYWGYKVTALGHGKYPYNCLPATQHYTRTLYESFASSNGTADSTAVAAVVDAKMAALVEAAKGDVLDGLEYAYDFFRSKYNGADLEPMEAENVFTQFVVEQVNRALINALAADYAHLQEVEVDYNPRHEAFWFVGGIKPPRNVVKSKEGRDWQKDFAHDPVDRLMQYSETPYLSVRHRHQLPAWQANTANAELAAQVPNYEYDPRTLGYASRYCHGTNIPGFWPGSSSGFGCISYQSRAHLLIRSASHGSADFQEALHAQAIQSSYAWLLAQANYNGFNTFSDLTYPMNTQTIITNGRLWSFYEYQLNTLLVHSKHVQLNERVNFCRGTDELQLYQDFDEHGKCVGFNAEVLEHLVRFYVNAPTVKRSSSELQPHLHDEHKRIADYPDEERRVFLERIYKHMTTNRGRHLDKPEIYLWEKIYKIDHKTRPMEPKRRFFELGINPWKRTLDQHQKVYIPRALRPEGPKSKKKWKPTYYP